MSTEESTPRPLLDVTDLNPTKKLLQDRRRVFRKAMPKGSKKLARLLYKFREKQRELLGSEDIEDPNPYDKKYVFYALKA